MTEAVIANAPATLMGGEGVLAKTANVVVPAVASVSRAGRVRRGIRAAGACSGYRRPVVALASGPCRHEYLSIQRDLWLSRSETAARG
jgi:hypothetical protein